MLEAPVALNDPIVRGVAFLIRTEEARRTTGIAEGTGSHGRRPGAAQSIRGRFRCVESEDGRGMGALPGGFRGGV